MTDFSNRLAHLLTRADCNSPGSVLQEIVGARLDQLDLPASGNTLKRWQALAQVAACNLSLVKLYEGHTDALAILAELTAPPWPANALWGVWCAESAGARVTFHSTSDNTVGSAYPSVNVSGMKSWCSGAHHLTHALISAWDENTLPFLVAVPLQQPGVVITNDGWHAIGMQDSGSVDVHFDNAKGVVIGASGAYVNRAGFWHGAGGIAACWYGALTLIADYVYRGTRERQNPYRLAHLGAIDVGLAQCASLLQKTAQTIDRNPQDSCKNQVVRARLAVEAAAEDIILRASRALGAAPLCRDAVFAQVMADLPIFVRQSHAEQDQAAHGLQLLDEEVVSWAL